ncbi:MAG: hypothetical protein FJ087_01345 [Deltaproteobacteria bacterium]|nr:hypothetical protein [Deltaproteobacteria bacterium]
MVNKIGSQVKDILDGSAAKLKDLRGEGLRVAGKVRDEGVKVAKHVRAKVDRTTAMGTQVVGGLVADLSVKDLIDRFGGMKLPEVVEKLKGSDIARHTDAIRAEVLTALRIPTRESVDRLTASVDKLAKEVTALKGLKAEVKKVADDVKAVKADSKKRPAARA